jgi:hypothetical protein
LDFFSCDKSNFNKEILGIVYRKYYKNNYFNQVMITLTNVTLISITSIGRILSLFSMIHVKKLEKFNELNFKTWQQEIIFYLTTLNLVNSIQLKMLV